MTVSRVFAVLAAILLVGSIALATLGRADWTLGEALTAFDPARLASAERWVRAHAADWWWDRLVRAVLVRPVWVVPAMLGLLAVGGAVTAQNAHKTTASRRRRS